MITALQCAQLCQELYDHPEPEHWAHLWSGGDVFCSLRVLMDEFVVVFRGSTTAENWERDLQPLPVFDKEVGFCHSGFLEQMDTALAEIIPALGTDAHMSLTVTGHSLGAARARIAAAKLTVRGVKVDQLLTFGSPRPGFANVRRIIEKSGMAHQSFRYNNDPVCLVPFPVPLVLPFEHTEDWTQLTGPSNPDDALGALRDHKLQNYIGALKS